MYLNSELLNEIIENPKGTLRRHGEELVDGRQEVVSALAALSNQLRNSTLPLTVMTLIEISSLASLNTFASKCCITGALS